ncbi:trypsin-like serine protease [Betaproteobacteria bacterium PRO7]|nr:trypsin-like serine protease [Betaproteobacteria bacterium PRO7]
MKRAALYSRSRGAREAAPPADAAPAQPAAPARPSLLRRLAARRNLLLPLAIGGLIVALVFTATSLFKPAPRQITQRDIDRAVLHTLNTKPLPSAAAKAYEAVRRSVVLVRGITPGENGEEDSDDAVGTGVVIVESGIILTNLHVVLQAKELRVVFADGSESEATVAGLRPEHDLAVLRAKAVPDDLQPATLGSTQGLAPGDQVIAVGFPFGIGPSVSAGVISGLKREFRSPQGKRVLTNLIQFDAAANPGNSGGPLVTMSGEVVGIVTAILNPSESRTFIGIGFAVPIENAAAGVGLHPF